MFKKILCPVDFSKFTQEVINYAVDLAKKYGAELHVMHVVPNMTYFTPYESFLTPENLVAIEKNIQDEVEDNFDEASEGSMMSRRKGHKDRSPVRRDHRLREIGIH